MAIINPNLGPITTSISAHKATTGAPKEVLSEGQSLPSDATAIDFSKGSKEEMKPSVPAARPSEAAPTPKAVVAEGGVQRAASEGGFAISNSGGLAQLDAPKAVENFSPSIDGCLASIASKSEIPTITASQVNWDSGAEVTSNARKFIMPVPNFEGEPLIYPDGAKDKDGNSIAGTPIKDWQGQPIGDLGVVFFNPKDQSWQAVKSDGQGVVIMNQMTEEQGKTLMAKVGGDPMNLTLDQFKEFLGYAASEVGCKDMYNSDRGFIGKKMNAIESCPSGYPQYGMFRRDDQDVCKALFAEGPAEFEAPTTGGILVKQQIPEEGGVLLRQPDGKVFLYRKIDNAVFEETYKHKNGAAVDVSELPRYE